jgi:hypothetical protein
MFFRTSVAFSIGAAALLSGTSAHRAGVPGSDVRTPTLNASPLLSNMYRLVR